MRISLTRSSRKVIERVTSSSALIIQCGGSRLASRAAVLFCKDGIVFWEWLGYKTCEDLEIMSIREGVRLLTQQNTFTYEELLACGRGELFGPGNAQLPLPPMLMFDRITSITADGGAYGKGQVIAELDIKPDLWFFPCHFQGDPVMPGCLGLDALWQMVGFFLGWTGASGHGRALGVGEVKFTEQVQPSASLVSFMVDIKRVVSRKITLGIADGKMLVDGTVAYVAEGMKVTLFTEDEDN